MEFRKIFALIILVPLSISACGVHNITTPAALFTPAVTSQVDPESPFNPVPTTDIPKLPGVITRTVPVPATPPVLSPKTPSQAPTKSDPNPSPSPAQPACLAVKGRFEQESLATDLLRYPLEFRIYLPGCYAVDTGNRYPVLYLFHGQGFKDDQWDRIGADETADRLIAQQEIPPMIIVMPYERSGGQPSESQFGAAVVDELIPYIDQKFRTIPDREHRAVGGLSRGGGWAIHFGLKFSHVFGALGGHSPAVFFSDAEEMRSILEEIPPHQIPRIYLDIGKRDRPEILRAAFWFEELLDDKSIPHEWHLFTGFHNEEYWKAHMAQYLRWYAQNW